MQLTIRQRNSLREILESSGRHTPCVGVPYAHAHAIRSPSRTGCLGADRSLRGALHPRRDRRRARLDRGDGPDRPEVLPGGRRQGVGRDLFGKQASDAIDFADNATHEELTALTGVGKAIAQRIIDARPFGTAESPLAALDGVGYVGANVLKSFRDQTGALWCSGDNDRQRCCTEGCSGLGDTVESYVEFDDAQAQMVLDWANRATSDQLQQVCYVGATVAESIIAARPLHTVAELADVPRIGSHALQNFIGNDAFSCTTKGTVEDTWCGLDGANCTCEATCASPESIDEYLSVGDIPTEITTLIEAWSLDKNLCDDDGHAFYPKVQEVMIHRADCAVTGYTVTLMQMLDPEGGIYYLIEMELGADFTVVDQRCSI